MFTVKVPILLAGIQRNVSVKCLTQEHNIVVILARWSKCEKKDIIMINGGWAFCDS